jgi:hypothetical protein
MIQHFYSSDIMGHYLNDVYNTGICFVSKTTNELILVRFQVLTVTSMKMTVSLDVAACDLVETDRRFGSVYCLHRQGYER